MGIAGANIAGTAGTMGRDRGGQPKIYQWRALDHQNRSALAGSPGGLWQVGNGPSAVYSLAQKWDMGEYTGSPYPGSGL